MANTQDRRTADAHSKAADASSALSDFQRDRESFKVVTRIYTEQGALRPENTGEICGAGLLDFLSGRLDTLGVDNVMKFVDGVLDAEDKSIKRELLALQFELRQKAAAQLDNRTLEARPTRKNVQGPSEGRTRR